MDFAECWRELETQISRLFGGLRYLVPDSATWDKHRAPSGDVEAGYSISPRESSGMTIGRPSNSKGTLADILPFVRS